MNRLDPTLNLIGYQLECGGYQIGYSHSAWASNTSFLSTWTNLFVFFSLCSYADCYVAKPWWTAHRTTELEYEFGSAPLLTSFSPPNCYQDVRHSARNEEKSLGTIYHTPLRAEDTTSATTGRKLHLDNDNVSCSWRLPNFFCITLYLFVICRCKGWRRTIASVK